MMTQGRWYLSVISLMTQGPVMVFVTRAFGVMHATGKCVGKCSKAVYAFTSSLFVQKLYVLLFLLEC